MIDRRMTRRQLVERGGATMAGLSLAGMLAACGGDGATTTQGSGAQRGTIKFSEKSPPPGYDPQKWWNATTQLGNTLFERLIQPDDYTGKRVPHLATQEPAIERDATRFTFTLRPGVKFHKGYGTLTAEDVKFSWERLMSPQLASEASTLYTALPWVGLEDYVNEKADEITGIQVVDDLTIQVDLEKPDSAFLPVLTYTQAAIVSQKAVQDMGDKAFNWSPVGTGPFMLDSADPSRGAKFVRHPGYWKEGVPHVDAVELTYNVDPELALLRIQKGELDIMNEPVPTGSVVALRDNPDLKNQFFEGPVNMAIWLSMPTAVKEFSDVRVRTAVAMAIDKEKLARVVKGTGDVATGGIFSPLSIYWEDGLAHPYDPSGAKQLLADAGYPDGFSCEVWSWDFAPQVDMGPAVQQDLAQIGIKATYKPMVYEEFVAKAAPGPPAALLWGYEDAFSHGSYIFDAAFTSKAIKDGCCNYSHWSSPETDALIQEGHTAQDEASQDVYKELQRIVVNEEVLWIPLLYPKQVDLVSARVRGYEVAKYPAGGFYKPFERYSLA